MYVHNFELSQSSIIELIAKNTASTLSYDNTSLTLSNQTFIIDNTLNQNSIILLSDPLINEYHTINISLLYQKGNNITIQTNKGSFILSSDLNIVSLYFNRNTIEWLKLDSNTSMFPTTQQGSKLVGTGYVGSSYQGCSVALSADGNTLAVGGYADNDRVGAVWIFIRNGSIWSQQGSKICPVTPRQGMYNYVGNSVSLSADGNTLAIGTPIGASSNNSGCTYIYIRDINGMWAQQAFINGMGGSKQGWSVSLSADGNTVACGAPWYNSYYGCAFIFVRINGVWNQQGRLTGTGGDASANQGISISLSSDGNTLAVGGNGDNTRTGAVWIFTRIGTIWTQQGGKLVGTVSNPNQYQGMSISLSSDGNTLAVGGTGDNTNTGAVWIWTRTNTVWTQQQKLIGTTAANNQNQGYSVSLSADGNMVAFGGKGYNNSIGAVWIFIQINGVWTQQGNKLIGTGNSVNALQGSSIALSSNGNTLAIGGIGDNGSTGATWIFT